ncbi:MAG: hypothetical protein L0I24_21610 [Pseudonocardia sp.]|nr:hypothetical protein [Pseudonocardia sp.]
MNIAQSPSVPAPRPAHSAADRPGWGHTPRSRKSYAVRPEGRALRALRVTAYALTSLASLVFLMLVGYVLVRFAQFQQLFPGSP